MMRTVLHRGTRSEVTTAAAVICRRFSVTLVVSSSSSKTRGRSNSIKSLALSVYFKVPELGMKDYEILSRASAFLLAVDPLPVGVSSKDGKKNDDDVDDDDDGPYSHLEANERARQLKLHKQTHKYTPAGNPGDNRELTELGWLEFAPREVRPTVHCLCSSHVVAPFLWKNYYPQDWLGKVRQEHCVYSLEVFDPEFPEKGSLGKFALNPYPIHHPEGRDVALIHLKQEDTTLRILQDLGVEILHLRSDNKDNDAVYEKGDVVTFDGYVVTDADRADGSSFESTGKQEGATTTNVEEDTRVFLPYQETGQLAFHTMDRFYATTPKPLPEGLCGGAVIDADGRLCGIVEGIVPTNHSNAKIAGSAAFMPHFVLTPFLDFAERFMLQKILPKSLFQRAVTAKTTGQLGGGIFQKDSEGRYRPSGPGTSTNLSYEEAFDRAVDQLKRNHSPEEVEAILNTIQRERREVMEIMDKEGGDLDEVAARVRARTMQIREMIHEEYRNGVQPNNHGDDDENEGLSFSDVVEAEVLEDKSRNF